MYVVQEMKFCCLIPIPTIYIHVTVSDLYIPRIGLPIFLRKIGRPILRVYKSLQQNRQTDPKNIQISHRYMNVEIGRQNIIILF
jgi:hypothetical protein